MSSPLHKEIIVSIKEIKAEMGHQKRLKLRLMHHLRRQRNMTGRSFSKGV
jgi:hypothetical protein